MATSKKMQQTNKNAMFNICDIKLYHACVSFITTKFIIPKKVITGYISERRRMYCKLSPRNSDMNSQHKGCTLRKKIYDVPLCKFTDNSAYDSKYTIL